MNEPNCQEHIQLGELALSTQVLSEFYITVSCRVTSYTCSLIKFLSTRYEHVWNCGRRGGRWIRELWLPLGLVQMFRPTNRLALDRGRRPPRRLLHARF